MSVHSRPDDRNEVMIVSVIGDLDLSTVPALRSATQTIIDDGWNQVVVDLGDVDFLDSAGLGVLIGVRRRCLAATGNCVLARVHADVQRILEMSGVEQLFALHSTLDDALTDLRDGDR